MKLSHRAQTIEPFHALAFGQQAAALEAQGHRVVKLSIGEPDFGAPPAVREAMRGVMDGRPLPYTPALGLPALRQAIAGFYRDRHGVQVDPARIAITSGASAALLLVTAATTDPGDEVILADPCYPCNRQLVETFGGRVVIRLADGRVIEDEIAVADAHPLGARPFARDDYVAKFRTLAAAVLEEDEIERFLALAQRLPELNAAELGALTITARPGLLAGIPTPRGLF